MVSPQILPVGAAAFATLQCAAAARARGLSARSAKRGARIRPTACAGIPLQQESTRSRAAGESTGGHGGGSRTGSDDGGSGELGAYMAAAGPAGRAGREGVVGGWSAAKQL